VIKTEFVSVQFGVTYSNRRALSVKCVLPWRLTNADGSNTVQMSVFRRVRKTGKSYYYFFMSVRRSARNNSAPIKRIFLKYDISIFLENLENPGLIKICEE